MPQLDFIGPGMTGPNVERIQRLVGVPETGTYDEPTVLRVRGFQMLHHTTLSDGCWDAELESKMIRVSG